MSTISGTTVLLIGANGNNGKRVLRNLLSRGVEVRAMVRNASSLEDFASDERCKIIEASILDIEESVLIQHLQGAHICISCLGHNISMNGLWGRPKYLCRDAIEKVIGAVRKIKSSESKVKVILHGTIGADNPDGLDPERTFGEKVALGLLRCLINPHVDNEMAAKCMHDVGQNDPLLEWVTVRPDDLVDEEEMKKKKNAVGSSSPEQEKDKRYAVYERPHTGLFNAGITFRNHVAAFISDLVTDESLWEKWKGKMPVIYTEDCNN